MNGLLAGYRDRAIAEHYGISRKTVTASVRDLTRVWKARNLEDTFDLAYRYGYLRLSFDYF